MVLVVEIDDLCNCQKEIHSLFVLLHKKEAPYVYVDPGNPIPTKPIVCMPKLSVKKIHLKHFTSNSVKNFTYFHQLAYHQSHNGVGECERQLKVLLCTGKHWQSPYEE